MTNKQAAQTLRSAASAIEHGRTTTFRNKVQVVASAFGISLVFLPKGKTANERAKEDGQDAVLSQIGKVKVWYGIVYKVGSDRTVLYDLGYKTETEARDEALAFFSPSESARVVSVDREILGWPRETPTGPYIDWIEA